ncbi:MAG: MFS transporter [Clostridia bacterium]
MEDEQCNLKKNGGYSWLICMACMLLIICTMGTCTNAFSVYLPYIESQGLNASAGSMILSVRCFFSLIGMVLVPLFYRRLSHRLGMTLTCVMAASAFLIYSVASSPLLYYTAAAMAGLAYGLGSLIPVSLVLNRWFKTNRGFAMGLCTAGTGISTICFPPLITWITETYNLQISFLLESVFILGCALLIWFVLRDTPEETGREPYRKGPETAKTKAANDYNLSGIRWPLMITAILMLGGVSTAAPGHFPVLFTSEGYSVYAASAAVSVFGVTLALGKLVYGKVADRLGGFRPSVGFLVFLAAGCFFSCVGRGDSAIPIFLAAFLMGFGFPLATVGLSVLSGDLADKDHYMSTLKWFQIAYAGGGMLFSSLPGLLFERFGNYIISYDLFLCMTVFIIAVIATVYRHRHLTLAGRIPAAPVYRRHVRTGTAYLIK